MNEMIERDRESASQMEETQPRWPAPIGDTRPREEARPAPGKRTSGCGCAVLLGVLLGLAAGIYFFAPIRTNVLLLGSDRRPAEDSSATRSDMLILTTIVPTRAYIGMLSIPRDLWVEIPGYGPNRINAAHALAEAAQPGSGPEAAVETVRTNFGVDVHGYVRLEFAGFVRFVDALGGVDVDLAAQMGGYAAGRHHLDGTQALAFARDRMGTDDFFRMERGQILLRSILRTGLNPLSLPRWPVALGALLTAVDSDIPSWLWPRLALAVLRAGPGGIDARVIGRDMAQGFTTNAGAQVLAPDWSRINPVLLEMFGQ